MRTNIIYGKDLVTRIAVNAVLDKWFADNNFSTESKVKEIERIKAEYLRSLELQKWEELTVEELSFFSKSFDERINEYRSMFFTYKQYEEMKENLVA